MHQVEMQLQQAQIELAQARAKADIGLYAERTSRVEENHSMAIERLHRANSEDESAMLDKVKALRELESMDISHIQQLIEVANSIRQTESDIAETSIGKVAGQTQRSVAGS